MTAKVIPEAIIFDFDGTLVDSERVTLEVSRPVISKYLGRPITDEELNSLKGKVWKIELARIVPGRDRELHEEIVREFERKNPAIDAYPSVHRLLSDLRDMEISLGIASSRRSDNIRSILEKLGMDEYFEIVVGQEDTRRHKPDPDPLLLAAAGMNTLGEKCIYIGDQPGDIQASRAAGMLSGAALWGEGKPDEMVPAFPDYVFREPEDISALFNRG